MSLRQMVGAEGCTLFTHETVRLVGLRYLFPAYVLAGGWMYSSPQPWDPCSIVRKAADGCGTYMQKLNRLMASAPGIWKQARPTTTSKQTYTLKYTYATHTVCTGTTWECETWCRSPFASPRQTGKLQGTVISRPYNSASYEFKTHSAAVVRLHKRQSMDYRQTDIHRVLERQCRWPSQGHGFGCIMHACVAASIWTLFSFSSSFLTVDAGCSWPSALCRTTRPHSSASLRNYLLLE